MIGSPPAVRRRPLVLVADDDDMARLLFRETLENAGFDVVEAVDGLEAIEAVERHLPDLVVLDVMMPRLDGFNACSRIRAKPASAHLPILMATGLDDIAAIEGAYEVGATDFIGKPVNWTLLGHRLRYMHRSSCAADDLRVSQARLAKAERIARLGNWAIDGRGDVFSCSAGVCGVLGLDVDHQLSVAAFLARVDHADRDRVQALIDDSQRAGRGFAIDFRIVRTDGAERVVTATAEIGDDQRTLVGTLQDITERRQTEARIQHLAHYDALTDLPNRVLFRDRLEHAIARAKRDGSMVAVLGIDIDRFKEVNDTLGHAAGDLLLHQIGVRLERVVRGSDTVARLGGDEFAIIQVGVGQPDASDVLAERVLADMVRPLDLDGQEFQIGASIGIALFPAHGRTLEELLMKADVALYRAKADGRGVSRTFEAGMDMLLRARRQMEQDLRQGLAEGWFELHYQPQMTVDGTDLVGAEALIRMRHPEHGLVPPGEFIAVAEETGLIVPIGAWVLRTACAQAAAWRAEGAGPIRIGVNLSPAQMRQADLVASIEAILAETGLPADLLELEITEGVLIHDTAAALDVLGRLRELGVRIAMDDFGTGYSSLSYLQLFPFDRIKVDRSFVQQISENPDSAAIVRAIVALGRSLNMLTTAEGVETSAQLAYLRGEACDEVQGFYFGRAVPADQFAEQITTAQLHRAKQSA